MVFHSMEFHSMEFHSMEIHSMEIHGDPADVSLTITSRGCTGSKTSNLVHSVINKSSMPAEPLYSDYDLVVFTLPQLL
jgi:hypothetical protein